MDKHAIFLLRRLNFKPILAMGVMFLVVACAAGPQERKAGEHEERTPDRASETVPLSQQLADDADPELLFHVTAAERLAETGQFIDAAEQYLKAALLGEYSELARQASRLAARLGQWELLIDAAERWAELDPESRDAVELKILARINIGEKEAALGDLELLIDQHDDKEEGWQRAAMLIGVSEDDEQALEILSELVRRSGRDRLSPEILHIQSRLQWQAGDVKAALDTAMKTAAASEERRYLVWVAQLASIDSDYELALDYYRRARQLAPDDLPLALSEAEALRQLERRDEALELLAGLEQDMDVLYSRILYLIEADEHDTATAVWHELAGHEPDEDVDLHAFMVAQLAELLERDEDALVWYRRVEGSNRDQAGLRQAVLLHRSGDGEAAWELLRELRGNGEWSSVALQSWMLEAELLRKDGRGEEAVARLSEALRERPGSLRLLYSRALAAVAVDDIDLAEQDLRRIIQMDGQNQMALNALGYILTDRTDRHAEAYRLIRRAHELDPDDPATLDSMGWVYFRLGQPERALPYLEQALEGEDNPEIAAHLIEVLWTLDRRDEAREVLEHALDTYPDDDYLVDTLERLGLPE